jgi:uncharacterized damage-inducible protein DinB
MSTIGTEFIITATRRMKYYKDLGDKTFEQLSDDDFHYRPNEESNSIAIIIRHMVGNMLSRWTNFLTEDGEKEWRERDDEFALHTHSKKELLEAWDEGWNCFLGAIESLNDDNLLQMVHIRQEPLTVIDAINRQLAHYPYHIGQIIYIAKILKDSKWKNLSILRGDSRKYNQSNDVKDPAKKY